MARLMGKVEVDEDVWTLALDRTRTAYDLYEDVRVSFSGGKDSTVVLHAAIEVARERDLLPVPVTFYDEEGIPFETEEYMRRVVATGLVDLDWLAIPLRCRTACDPASGASWWPWAPESEDLWCRPMPPEATTSHPATDGVAPADRPSYADFCHDHYRNTAWLMGIRANESITRLRSVLHRTTENYIITTRNGNAKFYPIYDMTTPDVWWCVKEHGWDYNEAYDLMEMYGVGAHHQRIAPPFGEEPLRQLHQFAALYPTLWDRLHQRVPGADAAARYFTTPVWASGTVVEKPDNLTWPAFVRTLIAAHPPEKRDQVVRSVKAVLRQHRIKTDDPILTSPHPASGVAWPIIATTAASGDTMSRKLVNLSGSVSTPALRRSARVKYEAELAAIPPAALADYRP